MKILGYVLLILGLVVAPALAWFPTAPPSSVASGVTNGDAHDHSGGDGAQIDHTGLANIGTNTHAQIDTYISTHATDVTKVGTPAQYQWGEWTGDGTIKGTTVTGSSVTCTDANGSPVACSNLADIAYQPADTELSVIAGLTSAANKIPYFTGSGTGDLLDFATTVGDPGSDTTIVSEQGIREAISALSSTYLALAGTGIMTGDLVFTEAADHSSTPGAGYGYLWVRNDTPNVLVFTNDAGTDTVLGSGGAGETNTASSQGSGTSVYYQKSGVDIQLNAIKSESDDITVSLDGVSHDIELTFVPGNVGLNEFASGVPNLAADSIDTITEIAAALKSGADGTLITGTAGTSGYVALWNSDGDIIDGYDPTSKADVAGETFTGLIITDPSDATAAGLRLGHGTAPSAPTNGDIWTTTAGLYARINGATVGPFGTGGNTALDDIAVPDAAVSLALGAYQHLFSLSADTSAFRLGSATDYFEFVRSGTDYIFRIVDGGSDGNIYAQLGTLTIVDEGIAIQTGESDADYFSLAAYDLDGTAQVSLLRPVASNTPHLELGPASNHLQVSQAGVVSFAGTSYIANIELGAADDTTITRTGAGAIAVEGVAVLLSGGALGTPSSGTGTNLTGIPISTGLTGAGTGVLAALAVNVGSAGAPVLYNGALGQPSSGDGTNILTPSSTSLPGTCTVGQTYIDTDADTDGSLYICVATDTWKEVDDDGGAGSGDLISEGDSNVEVIDAGTGQIDFDIDGANYFRMVANLLTFGTTTDFRLATTTSGHNYTFQIYDNDGASWIDAIQLINNNTPSVTYGAVAVDLSSALSLTIPTTTSGDQTLTVGMLGIKTDEDLIVAHGGANGEVQDEVGLSLLQHISFPFDPSAWYDQESTYRSVPIMRIGDDFPHGFTITEWRVTYVGGDPTTELDADLICDTTPDFNTAAGATVMDVLDTTTGASSADTGFDSATCANGSELYIHFGADPTDANVVVQFDLWGYAEED